MTVEKELRPGDTVEYQIDGKTLVLEPVPYGRLKKLIKQVMDAVKDVGQAKEISNTEFAGMLPDLMEKHVVVILPLLFNPQKHPYMGKDWIEENMTIPLVTDIVKKAIKINGLDDFFGKMVKQNPQEERPLVESPVTPTTPLENTGSITSSASPINGASNTSMG